MRKWESSDIMKASHSVWRICHVKIGVRAVPGQPLRWASCKKVCEMEVKWKRSGRAKMTRDIEISSLSPPPPPGTQFGGLWAVKKGEMGNLKHRGIKSLFQGHRACKN